jgi:tRNA-binding EMAP/Myf-like protein
MPQKEETNYDDFMKMDLRVAEILTGDSVKVAQVQQIDGNDRRH